ncbi:MAG: PAS domain S-box protein [Ignavibacteriales bacterium]|nr:PAS domain S-box protein [Ignavibacteriales bacterium]
MTKTFIIYLFFICRVIFAQNDFTQLAEKVKSANGNFAAAFEFFNRNLKLASEVKLERFQKDILYELSDYYSKLGNYKNALKFYHHNALKDLIYNEETVTKISKIKQTNELERNNNMIKKLEGTNRTILIFSLLTNLILALILTVVAYKLYQLKKISSLKIKKQANELKLLEHEIELKNEKLASLESAFKQSEEQFRTIFEKAGIGMVITDLDGKIIRVNESFIDFLGYSQNELTNLNFSELTFPEDRQKAFESIQKDTEKLNTSSILQIEQRYVTKNGENKWGSLTASFIIDLKGAPVFKLCMVKDITKRKLAEERLEKSEELYRKLITAVPDVVTVTDLQGKIIFQSISGLIVGGYSSLDELLGTNMVFHIAPIDRERAVENTKLMFNKSLGPQEYFFVKKDGTFFNAEVNGEVLRDEAGASYGMVFIARDITERKQSEQRLKRYAEELKVLNASKDKFFSIVAHDLKSPFLGLLGFANILLLEFDTLDSSEIRKFVGDIHRITNSIYKLVENLLSWSRLHTNRIEFKPESISLYENLIQSINLLFANAANKNIQIKNMVADKLKVYTDENMLQSILENLLSNAIKFTNEGGLINISAIEKTTEVEICIEDNGVGLEEENIKNLFKIEKHYTTRGTANEEGTGLGLIICKEIVKKHGGKIWVESKVQSGSKFYFTLPKLQIKIDKQLDKQNSFLI